MEDTEMCNNETNIKDETNIIDGNIILREQREKRQAEITESQKYVLRFISVATQEALKNLCTTISVRIPREMYNKSKKDNEKWLEFYLKEHSYTLLSVAEDWADEGLIVLTFSAVE